MGGIDLQGGEQAGGVLGELGDRELRLSQPGARADAAMVVDDHVEVAAQVPRKARVPVSRTVPLIPMITSIGGPEPARS